VIYVLGLGNVLMGDDGFGPAVVRAFDAEYLVGSDVDVVDLGTPGLDLSPWLFDAESIIIVDTVDIDAAPGTLRVYDKAALLKHAPGPRVGPHDPGVKEALHTAELAGRAPHDVTLIGVKPLSTAMSLELTGPVRAALPKAIEQVVDTLRAWRVSVAKREDPRRPAPWWSSESRHGSMADG
jgi:hydrogenase maturation protease